MRRSSGGAVQSNGNSSFIESPWSVEVPWFYHSNKRECYSIQLILIIVSAYRWSNIESPRLFLHLPYGSLTASWSDKIPCKAANTTCSESWWIQHPKEFIKWTIWPHGCTDFNVCLRVNISNIPIPNQTMDHGLDEKNQLCSVSFPRAEPCSLRCASFHHLGLQTLPSPPPPSAGEGSF